MHQLHGKQDDTYPACRARKLCEGLRINVKDTIVAFAVVAGSILFLRVAPRFFVAPRESQQANRAPNTIRPYNANELSIGPYKFIGPSTAVATKYGEGFEATVLASSEGFRHMLKADEGKKLESVIFLNVTLTTYYTEPPASKIYPDNGVRIDGLPLIENTRGNLRFLIPDVKSYGSVPTTLTCLFTEEDREAVLRTRSFREIRSTDCRMYFWLRKGVSGIAQPIGSDLLNNGTKDLPKLYNLISSSFTGE